MIHYAQGDILVQRPKINWTKTLKKPQRSLEAMETMKVTENMKIIETMKAIESMETMKAKESIKETIQLYNADAYATEFEAVVLSCEELTDKKGTTYAVVLDQTLFFPEEGGQSPDKGVINDITVCDVQIKKDVITHYLEKPLNVGENVKGVIDWNHRFFNMQQHSGEHIFSGIVHERFGYDNVGFHLSDQIVSMDFSGVLTQEEIDAVEWSVNEVITKNVEIQISYPSKEELAQMDYRSKIEIEGQVRIVTIPGYDVCACCAPHVKRTGEIGMLKVMSVQNYKGGVRVTILCGFRALTAFREKAQVVSELMGVLTTGQEKLVDTVSKLKNNNQNLSYQLAVAKQTLLQQKVADLPVEQKDVVLFESGIEAQVMRNVINQLMETHPGICGIFSGSDEEGYSFIIGSKEVDCKVLAGTLREKLGARGGGSPQMIQGSVTAPAGDIKIALGV